MFEQQGRIVCLQADPDFKPARLKDGRLPFLGVLLKKSGDYQRAVQFSGR